MKKAVPFVIVPTVIIAILAGVLLWVITKVSAANDDPLTIRILTIIAYSLLGGVAAEFIFCLCAGSRFFFVLACTLGGVFTVLCPPCAMFIAGAMRVRAAKTGCDSESVERGDRGAGAGGLGRLFRVLFSWRTLVLLLCLIPTLMVIMMYQLIVEDIRRGHWESLISTWCIFGFIIFIIGTIVGKFRFGSEYSFISASTPGGFVAGLVFNIVAAPLACPIMAFQLLRVGIGVFANGFRSAEERRARRGGRAGRRSGGSSGSSAGGGRTREATGLESELSRADSSAYRVYASSSYGSVSILNIAHSVGYGAGEIVFNMTVAIRYSESSLGGLTESDLKSDVRSVCESIQEKVIDIGMEAIDRAREKHEGYDREWSVGCSVTPDVSIS